MKKKQTKKSLAGSVRVIKQDLIHEHSINATALRLIEVLGERISPELQAMLVAMLLGFDEEMQLEIADDLVDFACSSIVHLTGCPSADWILKLCYMWIAKEQGYEREDIFSSIETLK